MNGYSSFTLGCRFVKEHRNVQTDEKMLRQRNGEQALFTEERLYAARLVLDILGSGEELAGRNCSTWRV